MVSVFSVGARPLLQGVPSFKQSTGLFEIHPLPSARSVRVFRRLRSSAKKLRILEGSALDPRIVRRTICLSFTRKGWTEKPVLSLASPYRSFRPTNSDLPRFAQHGSTLVPLSQSESPERHESRCLLKPICDGQARRRGGKLGFVTPVLSSSLLFARPPLLSSLPSHTMPAPFRQPRASGASWGGAE